MTSKKPYLRVIGDVHGHYTQYLRLIRNVQHSVQLGDFGFEYGVMKDVEVRHRLLPGNHDNYDELCKNHIRDYGNLVYDNFSAFFIRGGFSIDWKLRLEHKILTGKKCSHG